MKFFLGLMLLAVTVTAFAQKKPLNYTALENWPTLKADQISNDGKFVTYNINTEKTGNSLFVQATNSFWKREFKGRIKPIFTQDNKLMVYSKSSDSIGILELGTDRTIFISDIATYKCLHTDKMDWLVYRLKTANQDIVIRPLNSGKEVTYRNVKDYGFSETSGILYMQFSDNSTEKGIVLLNLFDGKSHRISGNVFGTNFMFDQSGRQIIFCTQEKFINIPQRNLWYFREGMDTAKNLIDYSSDKMEGMKVNDDQPYFGNNGKTIFFSLSKLDTISTDKPKKANSNVEVWNYKHIEYQYNPRDKDPLLNQTYLSVVDIDAGNSLILQKPGDTLFISYSQNYKNNGDFILVKSLSVVAKRAFSALYLISTVDGSRKFIKEFADIDYQLLSVSPDLKMMVWFDMKLGYWVSFDIDRGVKRVLTSNISKGFLTNLKTKPALPFGGVVAWMFNQPQAFFYDQFDIWLVDLKGIKPARNVTHGFGQKRGIQFRLANFSQSNTPLTVNKNDTLLLTAFDAKTRKSGFYNTQLNKSFDPELLTFEPYAYYFYPKESTMAPERYQSIPIKAKNAKAYITYRMNANTYPNLLVTRDFKNYKPLTSLNPTEGYNWYSNELIHWKMLDGDIGDGMLFKPNDFNPNKKYPVVFYYYEINSSDLNLFINPALSNGIMNIPWYVSHGYIVCVPDIRRKTGYPGPSAYNAIVSLAQYLQKFPWINKNRLGLQGHSHGGFETNYVITHSSLFAAAATASGLSELINKFNGYSDGGADFHSYFESGQGGIGSSLWKATGLYIANSPILKADKVSTPLLIMHNKGDAIVDWLGQGFPWFNALQSLGKKVWMLQYDGEGHTIRATKNQLDYSIRLNQFFDYYLKDKPAPKWMTQGIPSWRRGIDDGLVLDPGVTP